MERGKGGGIKALREKGKVSTYVNKDRVAGGAVQAQQQIIEAGKKPFNGIDIKAINEERIKQGKTIPRGMREKPKALDKNVGVEKPKEQITQKGKIHGKGR